ncbi:MAG: hypothetical protein ACOYVK_00605 [Bacillota bacterium]
MRKKRLEVKEQSKGVFTTNIDAIKINGKNEKKGILNFFLDRKLTISPEKLFEESQAILNKCMAR